MNSDDWSEAVDYLAWLLIFTGGALFLTGFGVGFLAGWVL